MMDKQQQAIKAINAGESMSLVGPAGSGKTTVIRESCNPKTTVIVAPTAVAALNIGGSTAHSVFSLSHGLQTQKDLRRIPSKLRSLFGVDSPVDKLVIDEAFALQGHCLDAIDQKLRTVRDVDLPFGGIQVVLSGDPTQCCPWWSDYERKVLKDEYKSPFIFDSKVWNEMNPQVVVLNKVYRNIDPIQLRALNAIRLKGKGWKEAIDYINSIAKIGVPTEDDLFICTFREDVEEFNQEHYSKVAGNEVSYTATYTGTFKRESLTVDHELKLKVGTKVICTCNNQELGYYNGLQGVVTELNEEFVAIKTKDGASVYVEPYEWKDEELKPSLGGLNKVVTGTATQLPIRYGWANTINSSQGLTLESGTIDLGRQSFGAGMLYVGLSRLTNLRNLTLVRPIEYSDLKTDRKALWFIKRNS